ncbi:MAG: HAD family hydrolase, partial [Candidatus Hermodarchaeota archaeon]
MGRLKAVLFDLDGTLLDVDLDKFIPGYLNLIANSLAHLIPPKKVIRALLNVSEIINSNDGKITNEEAFVNSFFPLEGYGREDLKPIFDKFYENVFPELRKFTKRK